LHEIGWIDASLGKRHDIAQPQQALKELPSYI
jgi:hypothetical protein